MATSWIPHGSWVHLRTLSPKTYVCGFCGSNVASKEGYVACDLSDGTGRERGWIYICPGCKGPTFFASSGARFPGSPPGKSVANVPDDLYKLYSEARISTAQGAYTGAVLICRKMLMNIAVAEGAKEGESFLSYVQYLADKGYVPPRGEVWVDYIRRRGNEANHEIALMGEEDAAALITFVEMLLRFIYEFPGKVPPEQTGL